MSDRITRRQRDEVAKRAQDCCEYCRSQARFAAQPFAVEHIVPKSLGGRSVLDNLALACQGCNNYKYNHTEALDPLSNEPAPLFHPRIQRWQDHFCWDESCTLMMGLTPTGRCTVGALRLNRIGLVNLRRVLFDRGEHPPTER